MSCGMGEATDAQLITQGGYATDQNQNVYTLHHSNAKIVKVQVVSMTVSEFASGYYMTFYGWDSSTSKFWHYILGYDSSSTVLPVKFKRSWNSGSWGDFQAVSGETQNVGSNDMSFEPCKKEAMWYTGAYKPSVSGDKFYAFHDSWTYSPSESSVYAEKQLGLLQPSADVDLICASVCYSYDSGAGQCRESSKCPKQAFAGQTLPSSGSTCTGSGCTFYEYSSDKAYKYKFKTADAKLYSFTDNSGSSVTTEVAIDGTTGVSYSSNYGNAWSETTFSEMYPGTSTSDFDSDAKVAAYKKVNGNIIYRVGIGKKGGYSGWTFYAKNSQNTWLTLSDPISCTVTMSTAFDANGGSSFNGAKYELSLYDTYTGGLTWEQLSAGNSDVGTRTQWVASPQIADGAQCVASDGTAYRLKAQYTMISPNAGSGCSAWNSMTNAGTLPSTYVDPPNKDKTPPTPTKQCIAMDKSFTQEQGCIYIDGTTSA